MATPNGLAAAAIALVISMSARLGAGSPLGRAALDGINAPLRGTASIALIDFTRQSFLGQRWRKTGSVNLVHGNSCNAPS